MGKERMSTATQQPKESEQSDGDMSTPRSYYDYIAQLKHVEIPKPPESQITCAQLDALNDDPTLAYVDVPIERAFEIGKFDVLRKDPESGRKFFEFCIPRDCDVVRDIRSSNDFEVSIGSRPYGKAEGDAILLIAAQYHDVKVKIFVEQEDVDVTLSYVGSMFEKDHRRALACASWETKTAFYCGGMVSKISAAKLATRAGCGVFIASGAEPEIIARLLAGRGPGTFFVPSGLPMEAKKRWLAYFQRPAGTIFVNARAVPVLREQGRSLLAVGVTGAGGDFAAGDIVNIAGPEKEVFARGKAAFSCDEIPALAGQHGDAVATLHPSRKRLEVVHRNDLVLL
jgi:hypothetical protein